MRLVKPNKKYEKSWKLAVQEFKKEGYERDFLSPDLSIDKVIKKINDNSKGKNLPYNFVPSSTYWLVEKDVFIGHINIRHYLNEDLKKINGHIGYAIRPSMRRRGYGTEILKRGILKARSLGIKSIFITCDDSNIGSRRIIEKNKGKLKDIVFIDKTKKRRYWIY